jgi:hypothetical protein
MAVSALVERGIGATRALVLRGGEVVAAHLERDDEGPRFGAIHVARLVKVLEPGRRGLMRIGDVEALIEPLPYCAEGGLLRVEVVRGAIPEAGRPRLAKLRNIEGEAAVEGEVTAGLDLVARLRAAGLTVTILDGGGEDRLEAAGWGETVEAARTGFVVFPGGLLTISPTPAMTVIDIDGPGDPGALAMAAATAVAAAIARFDITGSIGVDFPTLEGKAARAAIGEALDAALPAPFERTAVNGWGFVQIVRPRRRASFVEAVRAPGFAALELLRTGGRAPPGSLAITANPAIIAWLGARPALIEALARRCGGVVRLHDDARLGMVGGHVASC